MSDKLKYGCVGAGGIADTKHLKGYSKIMEVEMVAICDANLRAAEELAEKYNIPNVYQNYEDMLEKSDLDFISICTPNFLHAPVALLAHKKGIHVHCEKPIALNSLEAQMMVDSKKKYGKALMVGLNNRFTNSAYFVKKYADAGLLGEIYHAKCGWRRRRGIPGKGGWFTDKKLSGGGPLIDLGVHFIDLAMYFMGYPKAVSVSGATYSAFAENTSRNNWSYGNTLEGIYDVEDMAVGLIRLENGSTIDFEFSWASNIEQECNYYELLGTKGGVSFTDGQAKIFSEVMDTSVDIIPNTNYPKEALNEFLHFIGCMKAPETESDYSAEQALELMKIIDAVYKSAQNKKEVIIV